MRKIAEELRVELHTLGYDFIEQYYAQPLKHSEHVEPLRQLLEQVYRLGIADERQVREDATRERNDKT